MPSAFRPKPAILLGLLILIFALIVNAPAAFLASVLSKISDQHFSLANTQGSIWSGNAELVVLNEQQHMSLGHLAWNIQAIQLLHQTLFVTIFWKDKAPAQLALTRHGFKITHLDLDLPASAIAYLEPHLNAATLDGKIYVHCDQLSIESELIEGAADIQWQQASSGLSSINPLGNYLLQLKGQQSELLMHLSTLDGVLKLQGEGHFSAQAGLVFKGIASAEKQQEAMLPLLHAIGNEQVFGSGLFQFNF